MKDIALKTYSQIKLPQISFGQRKCSDVQMRAPLTSDVIELNNTEKTKAQTISELNRIVEEDMYTSVTSSYFIQPESTKEISKKLLQTIKDAEKKGIKLSKDDLIAVFENKIKNNNNNMISKYMSKFHPEDIYQLKAHEYLNNRMYSTFLSTMKKTPQKDNEAISTYFSRIIKLREKRVNQLEKFRISNIKAKLTYDKNDIQEEPIVLNEREKQHLIRFINKHINIHNIASDNPRPQLEKNVDMEKIVSVWKQEYLDGMSLPDNEELSKCSKAILQQIGRYNFTQENKNEEYGGNYIAEKDYKNEFKYEPVYRWLSFKNPNAFVESLPKNGEIYEPNRFQSCSSHKEYAELDYGDHMSDKNVKFIIHPKSETSKAYNIGYNQEVIYPNDVKFKIIDKELIEHPLPKTQNSICRWEIHMQEV